MKKNQVNFPDSGYLENILKVRKQTRVEKGKECSSLHVLTRTHTGTISLDPTHPVECRLSYPHL